MQIASAEGIRWPTRYPSIKFLRAPLAALSPISTCKRG